MKKYKIDRFIILSMTISAFCFLLPASFAAELAAPEVVKAPSDAGLDKTIFLDLRDINVIDILKFLAVEGNLNIVTSKNVQGRSTLLLKNVAIRDALDIIVMSNRLAYNIQNAIIYVMTEEEYQQMFGKNFNDQKHIETRTLKYAKPSYVLGALQAIQSAIGKVIIDEDTGSVVMIDTKEKLAAMSGLLDQVEQKLPTKVVKLQYAKAKDVEAQLKSRLDAKSVGTIFGDERSNQIVVSAYPKRMGEILRLIKSLDRKTMAVLIDARILQVTINPQFDYGIDWEKTFTESKESRNRTLDLQGAFPIASTVSSTSSLGTVGKMTWGNLTADEWTTTIKMMEQVQKTNLLASPRLMVLDRQEAKINIGDRVPYVITTTTGTGTNVSVSEDIKFIDIGLTLVVTPVINDDGFITMKIKPEISSQTGTLATPTTNLIPKVNTTYIETSIVVKDGVTIILGGLRRDEMNETDKGIPYLMKIPLFGNIFKSRSNSSKKTEIVIFITPKIITGEESMTADLPQIKPMRLDQGGT